MMLDVDGRPMAPQRVFCIGRNYADHIAELGGETPDEPVIFMKPATALLPEGRPVPVPTHGRELHYEGELVVLIGREGRVRDVAEADAFVAGVSLGLDMTLRDVQRKLFAGVRPWELCKAFDGSAPVGRFSRLPPGTDWSSLRFTCSVNGVRRQEGDLRHMLFPIPELLVAISRAWTLLPGDLIYTGTPEGVGEVVAGDEVVLSSDAIGAFSWRIGG